MATIPEALEAANRHYQAGDPRQVEAICRQVLQADPTQSYGWCLLGAACQAQGKFAEAEAAFLQVLQANPNHGVIRYNLGLALASLGRTDEALVQYRQAVELDPDLMEAKTNLAILLKGQRKLEEATALFRQVLELQPNSASANYNLANALVELGQLDEAGECYDKSLALDPNQVLAHNNLGNVRAEQGRLEEAIACFQRAVRLDPKPAILGTLVHHLQHVCRWDNVADLSQRVLEAVGRATSQSGSCPPPFAVLALPTPIAAREQYECACRWAESELKPAVQGERRPATARPRQAGAKITLGYLSADFRAHVIGYQVAELFEKHERDQFAVFGYSYGPNDRSPIRQRIVNAFDRFADLQSASFADAARRIEADGVDILIDLQGYTALARAEILALRPAPIQVNYLGFASTMGAPFMDYILVDNFVVPPQQQPFFTEKLVYLPNCYQVNDSQRPIADSTPSREECGLPKDGFVFCCFNNSYKYNPAVFDVWMTLLKEVEGSVLWLYEGNFFAPANLRREAAERGVAPERLVFALKLPLPEYLAQHRLADLFLDTYPYNGHGTASGALWAGCPVLTLAGQTFASRVAGSLLHTIGLPELVTGSLAEYQETALRLARDADLLTALRSRLQTNRTTSPLFDTAQFARHLEQAFATMWKIHASGEEPRGFAVSQT